MIVNGKKTVISTKISHGEKEIGDKLLGLMQTANTGNFMYLNAQEPVSGPDFISKPEQNDNVTRFERWRACVKVSWGLEG